MIYRVKNVTKEKRVYVGFDTDNDEEPGMGPYLDSGQECETELTPQWAESLALGGDLELAPVK